MELQNIGDIAKQDPTVRALLKARPGTFPQLPVNKIHIHEQVRKDYSEAGIVELADSIRNQGLLQPIGVRPIDGGYRVVVGHRRFLAVKRLGWESIPAIADEIDEPEVAVRQLVENIQRENLKPMEEAEALHLLMETRQASQAEIARQIGKSRQYVCKALSILKLKEKVSHAQQLREINDREILVSLASIDNDQQLDKALQCAQSGGTRAQVRRMAGKTPAKSRADQLLDQLRNELMKLALKSEASLDRHELQSMGRLFDQKLDHIKSLLPALFKISPSISTASNQQTPRSSPPPPAAEPAESLPFPGSGASTSTPVSISKRLSEVSYSFLSYTNYLNIINNNQETKTELAAFIKSRLPKLDEAVFDDASNETIHDYWNALPFMNIQRNVDGFFYRALSQRYNLPPRFQSLKTQALTALDLDPLS